MMHKRSKRVPAHFWALLAIIYLMNPAMVHAARLPGYLEVVGPTPLRFEAKPTPLVVAPKTNAPATVVAEATPAVVPEPRPATVTLPEAIRVLLGAPLWATLAENVLAELGSNFFKAPPAPAPEPPPSPTVTAEMLADFFKLVPTANGGTNSSSVNALPVPVFVSPSSQATYRTP